jgi:hypothetical protein
MAGVVGAVLALAACGGDEEENAAPVPVVPAWSCAKGGAISCENASARRTVTSGGSTWVECEWSCAVYGGRTGRVTAALWPTCSASQTISWSNSTCPHDGLTGSITYYCNGGDPYCSNAVEWSTPAGITCSREFAHVYCGYGSTTGTVTAEISVGCGRNITIEEPGGCG